MHVMWWYVIFDLFSEESVPTSSGENVRQLLHSTSTEELKKQDHVTYDTLESETSELDFYYGIGM